MKRAVDIAVSVVLLICTLPVIAVAAAMIRIRMGGPVLFKQQRPGKREKPFSIYKFRTMKDIRDANGELLSDAERITRLGSLLRKTSVDELPQLINVLKGDMSLVGPRPLLIKYLPYYTERERLRFTVRPGITGLAQISGRNSLCWNERLEIDARYVETRSMRLDLQILWQTAIKVVKKEGVSVVPTLQENDLDFERMPMWEVNA